MKNELESRSVICEVRAESDNGGNVLVGRPIVYDNRVDLGWFDEVIERGALDFTDLTDVRFLINHDTRGIPLARSRRNNGNSTMQLFTDDEGMRVSVQLDTENNAEAKALYSAVQRGDISGMSFMFSVKDEEWDDIDSDHPFRRIKSIGSVVEVSAVIFPAYPATTISARSKEALENARSALERARQQKATPLESGTDIELLKARNQNIIKLLGGKS